jgi:hypothetical protein
MPGLLCWIDGDLYVHRCPDCGSLGEPESRCGGHEGPLGGGPYEPKRLPVRVPGVGEEPAYLTWLKEQVERADAEVVAGGAFGNVSAAERRAFEAALDHFTRQPAGATYTHLQDLQVGEQPAGDGADKQGDSVQCDGVALDYKSGEGDA